MEVKHYILFRNHTSGMALYHGLKEQNIKTIIAPTPRSVSVCCGISLLFSGEDEERIRTFIKDKHMEVLDIVHIEQCFDINRNKFC